MAILESVSFLAGVVGDLFLTIDSNTNCFYLASDTTRAATNSHSTIQATSISGNVLH